MVDEFLYFIFGTILQSLSKSTFLQVRIFLEGFDLGFELLNSTHPHSNPSGYNYLFPHLGRGEILQPSLISWISDDSNEKEKKNFLMILSLSEFSPRTSFYFHEICLLSRRLQINGKEENQEENDLKDIKIIEEGLF